MITEAKLKHALKELLQTKSLDDINVTNLCEKCNCHRQTFYYHYTDIYDLLAAVFLNEVVDGVNEATDVKGVLVAILEYSKKNFDFIRSTYNSAAHDLVDAFFYNKIISKVFSLLRQADNYNLTVNCYRNISRRYANVVGSEFSYCFRDPTITVAKFERYMKRFINASLLTVLPGLVELSREERKR